MQILFINQHLSNNKLFSKIVYGGKFCGEADSRIGLHEVPDTT